MAGLPARPACPCPTLPACAACLLLPAIPACLQGDPKSAITAFCESEQIELLIMGTRSGGMIRKKLRWVRLRLLSLGRELNTSSLVVVGLRAGAIFGPGQKMPPPLYFAMSASVVTTPGRLPPMCAAAAGGCRAT